MALTNQNCVNEDIERKLNSGNTFCHEDQNVLSSHLLSNKEKNRIYKIINFPVVLYGCEACSLTHSLMELSSS
jgi:hypothetical protein